MPELLLELLSEEIPARMQARAAEDLRRLVCDGLKAAGLEFTDARAFATPRRLALVVDGLPASRADVREEKRGPRVGAPENAIQGFLKGAGLASLDQAEKRDTGKGEFWFAVTTKKGGPTADALPAILVEAMDKLPWPKSMKWGSGARAWVRPLQSIVARFDGETLRGQVPLGGAMAAIPFGDSTAGHRFHAPQRFAVAAFADYAIDLKKARVVLDAEERKASIRMAAEKLAAAEGLTVRDDPGLLDEVAGLVEWPVPLMGKIDDAFMDVPQEVLVTSMRAHQRYFACLRPDGSLAPRFVAVANIEASDGGKTIVAGNEKVLRARLSDAKFFWDLDRKTTLESRLAKLKDIVFHAKLGTQAERVERIVALAREIAPLVGADVEQAALAARLCKADLVSGLVGEFPELQGAMGRYLALAEGLPKAVADAIGEHYAPVGPSDRCPTAPVSVAVALADKLDTLAGFWAIDEKPTGSRDPFALRRAALGVIRLLIENRVAVNLYPFVALAKFLHSELTEQKLNDLATFVFERMEVQQRAKGVRADYIDAALGSVFAMNPASAVAKIAALQDFLGTDDGKSLLVAYNRAANIVRAEEKKDKGLAAKIAGAADAGRYAQDEEKAVAAALASADAAAQPALEREDYVAAMAALATIRAPLDGFFDKVTVNVEGDDALRLNRLKLLNTVRATVDRVADFSKIEG